MRAYYGGGLRKTSGKHGTPDELAASQCTPLMISAHAHNAFAQKCLYRCMSGRARVCMHPRPGCTLPFSGVYNNDDDSNSRSALAIQAILMIKLCLCIAIHCCCQIHRTHKRSCISCGVYHFDSLRFALGHCHLALVFSHTCSSLAAASNSALRRLQGLVVTEPYT